MLMLLSWLLLGGPLALTQDGASLAEALPVMNTTPNSNISMPEEISDPSNSTRSFDEDEMMAELGSAENITSFNATTESQEGESDSTLTNDIIIVLLVFGLIMLSILSSTLSLIHRRRSRKKSSLKKEPSTVLCSIKASTSLLQVISAHTSHVSLKSSNSAATVIVTGLKDGTAAKDMMSTKMLTSESWNVLHSQSTAKSIMTSLLIRSGHKTMETLAAEEATRRRSSSLRPSKMNRENANVQRSQSLGKATADSMTAPLVNSSHGPIAAKDVHKTRIPCELDRDNMNVLYLQSVSKTAAESTTTPLVESGRGPMEESAAKDETPILHELDSGNINALSVSKISTESITTPIVESSHGPMEEIAAKDTKHKTRIPCELDSDNMNVQPVSEATAESMTSPLEEIVAKDMKHKTRIPCKLDSNNTNVQSESKATAESMTIPLVENNCGPMEESAAKDMNRIPFELDSDNMNVLYSQQVSKESVTTPSGRGPMKESGAKDFKHKARIPYELDTDNMNVQPVSKKSADSMTTPLAKRSHKNMKEIAAKSVKRKKFLTPQPCELNKDNVNVHNSRSLRRRTTESVAALLAKTTRKSVSPLKKIAAKDVKRNKFLNPRPCRLHSCSNVHNSQSANKAIAESMTAPLGRSSRKDTIAAIGSNRSPHKLDRTYVNVHSSQSTRYRTATSRTPHLSLMTGTSVKDKKFLTSISCELDTDGVNNEKSFTTGSFSNTKSLAHSLSAETTQPKESLPSDITLSIAKSFSFTDESAANLASAKRRKAAQSNPTSLLMLPAKEVRVPFASTTISLPKTTSDVTTTPSNRLRATHTSPDLGETESRVSFASNPSTTPTDRLQVTQSNPSSLAPLHGRQSKVSFASQAFNVPSRTSSDITIVSTDELRPTQSSPTSLHMRKFASNASTILLRTISDASSERLRPTQSSPTSLHVRQSLASNASTALLRTISDASSNRLRPTQSSSTSLHVRQSKVSFASNASAVLAKTSSDVSTDRLRPTQSNPTSLHVRVSFASNASPDLVRTNSDASSDRLKPAQSSSTSLHVRQSKVSFASNPSMVLLKTSSDASTDRLRPTQSSSTSLDRLPAKESGVSFASNNSTALLRTSSDTSSALSCGLKAPLSSATLHARDSCTSHAFAEATPSSTSLASANRLRAPSSLARLRRAKKSCTSNASTLFAEESPSNTSLASANRLRAPPSSLATLHGKDSCISNASTVFAEETTSNTSLVSANRLRAPPSSLATLHARESCASNASTAFADEILSNTSLASANRLRAPRSSLATLNSRESCASYASTSFAEDTNTSIASANRLRPTQSTLNPSDVRESEASCISITFVNTTSDITTAPTDTSLSSHISSDPPHARECRSSTAIAKADTSNMNAAPSNRLRAIQSSPMSLHTRESCASRAALVRKSYSTI